MGYKRTKRKFKKSSRGRGYGSSSMSRGGRRL